MTKEAPMDWTRNAVFTSLALALSLAGKPGAAQPQAQRGNESPGQLCGQIYTKHYGPYDYRNQRGSIAVVEEFHFTPKVESLLSGQSGYIGGDLNYTLLAVPNHHRALVAVSRWAERSKADRTQGMDFDVECYFDRAIRFRPDDTVVRALYAQFLQKRKRTDEGIRQLDVAVTHAGENAISHFNLGLVYMDLGAHDKALAQAHKALAMGYTRPELADALKRAGRWQESVPAAAEPAAASAPTN